MYVNGKEKLYINFTYDFWKYDLKDKTSYWNIYTSMRYIRAISDKMELRNNSVYIKESLGNSS